MCKNIHNLMKIYSMQMGGVIGSYRTASDTFLGCHRSLPIIRFFFCFRGSCLLLFIDMAFNFDFQGIF